MGIIFSSFNGLEPKLRFPNFIEKWTRFEAENIFKNITDKNHPTDTVLTIQQGRGTLPRDLSGRNILYDNTNTKNYKRVQFGDFIIHLRSFEGGLEMANEQGIVSPAYTILRYIKPIAFGFYKAYFRTNEFINHILSKSVEGIRDGKQISYDAFKWLAIPYCQLEEQQKIADFLSLVDQRIEKQRQLVESLKKYKRGLFFEIFEQKRRFKDGNNKFYPKWEKKSLGTIFKERTERAIGNEELLSVTINSGVKKRCEVDVKDNSSDDKSKYKKLYPNDIAYNTMRMWQGASGVSLYEGIVSPAYTVITTIIPVKIGFFGYYFKYIKTIQIFQKFSQGLTSDTWNLKYPQLSEIQLLIPNIEEQEKIYETFKFLDDKILLSENTLNLLQDIKKGLLQKMFI